MIETERLILRKFELNDAEEVLEFGSNPEVNRYTGDSDPMSTLDQAKATITGVWHSDYEKYGYGRLALVEKASGRVIGFCGLKYLPEFDKADLGYRMLPEFWGKGYATESGKAALDYGHKVLGLKEILGLVLPGNEASVRVLLKLGFVETEGSPMEDPHGAGMMQVYNHLTI